MGIVFNVTDGKKKKSYLLQELLTIGRSLKNDIVLEADSVSGFHGQFYYSRGGLFYKDLNSKNGSFINGDKVRLCRFYIEDRLLIDGFTITIAKKLLTKEEQRKFARFPTVDEEH